MPAQSRIGIGSERGDRPLEEKLAMGHLMKSHGPWAKAVVVGIVAVLAGCSPTANTSTQAPPSASSAGSPSASNAAPPSVAASVAPSPTVDPASLTGSINFSYF